MNVRRFDSGAVHRGAITTRSALRAKTPVRPSRRATAVEGVPDGARVA